VKTKVWHLRSHHPDGDLRDRGKSLFFHCDRRARRGELLFPGLFLQRRLKSLRRLP
jgi:hypothetical protein